MELRNKFVWLLSGVLLSCCGQAIADFPYRYYNLVLESYRGILESDKPANDLDAMVCAPKPGNKNPCTVLLTPVFEKLKSDRQKLAVDLAECRANQN